ncbi:MAG: peptide chain release factor H [Flavobacteriaceae bacterium]
MKTKIIQITAGKGPAECNWVVAKVLKVLLKELVAQRLNYTILQQEKGDENGTVQSATIQLSGDDKLVAKFLKEWIGTVQWIGQSTFRKYNKRKNWFVGIFEIAKEQAIELQSHEVKYQAMRSSGPGGQHVNKVSSAIRAIHEPTGIQVVVMDTRSQHQNRKLAKQRLQLKVAKRNMEGFKASIKDQWENHQELERGNPVKIFIGTDFKVKKQKKNYKQQRRNLKNDLRNEY